MTVANPAHNATEAETASVPGHKKWCPQCYIAGVERVIKGFTIQHYDPAFPARIVPPLDPGTALSVRKTMDATLAQRADWPSDAADHPRHAGAQR